jgi:hypothetical protein
MATYYWVGGAGTWNTASNTNWALTSGGTGGLVGPPTSADDVIIDTSSGTGLITCTGAVCRDLTVTASQVINLGASSSTLSVFGNLSLPSGGSFNANPNTWTITFASTTTGKTITTNGKTIPNVVFNGVGGGWTLGDALNTSTRSITLTNGTFDTSSSGNYSVTSAAINLGAGTKTLNLNASTVTLSGDGGFNFSTNSANFTFNAGTSTITVTGTGSNVQPHPGGFTFYNVVFAGVPAISFNVQSAGTYNNLTFPTSNGFYAIALSDNQTINGTLTLGTANTAVQRIFVRSNTIGTARTITAATVATLSDIDFRDISFSASQSGTRLGNCLGNTNITFDAAKTVYWNLAGTQFWYANGWATSSGGTPAVNNFPLAQDTAVFDDAGAAGSIAPNGPWNIGTIDMSARTTAFTFNFLSVTAPAIYGSLTFFSNLTLGGGLSGLVFAGRGVTQTITSAGKTFPSPNTFTINNLTGTIQLADAFSSLASITFTSGTFNANNYNVTCTTFASNNSNTRTITMGSGTWTLSGTGTVWNLATTTGLTFNKDTANIVLSDTSTTARTFAGGGRTYNNLTIGGATGTSTLTITGTNTFGTIASTKTVAHTITFPNVTTTVSNWTITGTVGNVVTLQRTGASGTFTLAKSGGGVISGLDYLSISNSTASPTNTWYAGANSTNGGGNTNWLFTAGPTDILGSASINGTVTVTGLGNYTASGLGSMSASATVSSSSSLTFSVSGAINGIATVSALGSLSQFGIASINGTASVSALGGLLNSGQASITANGTVTANGNLVFGGQASVNGTTTVTADGYYIADGVAAISAFANVTALGNYTTIGTAVITANGTVIANGVIQGEGWNPITPSSDTWTTSSASSDTWTTISPSSDTWLRQG